MKNFLFLCLLVTFVIFQGCQRATSVIEDVQANTIDENSIASAKVIDDLRNGKMGHLYETAPVGYKFSQEGKLKYIEAYLFETNEGKKVEYYRFHSLEDYKTQVENTRTTTILKGNAGNPGAGCSGRGINCGWDPQCNCYYFPYN